jgi:hypothetical protein
MQGEYRGDFTRDTFHRANHFCRVLMQQGRVQLDADWNEQTSILLHFMRSLGADLIGQHGGPAGTGFAISVANANNQSDLQIGPGHYYVDGILCEASQPPNAGQAASLSYLNQPDCPKPAPLPTAGSVLVYLDVWERHVACAQNGRLREVALGGPDTATRAMVVCQVKFIKDLPAGVPPSGKKWQWPVGNSISDVDWSNWVSLWQPGNRGYLKAQVQSGQTVTDPCVISPESSYRGTENQLYRVEIHNGGTVSAAVTSAAQMGPSFKWSRENGSVIFPILKLATSANQTTVTLAGLGRDSNLGLQVNDWAEVVDDNSSLSGSVDSLLQVVAIDSVNLVVTLAGTSSIVVAQPPNTHPILRRWDGTAPITESNGSLPANWLSLEDGIQIQFQPAASGPANQYRSGDFWLIPARVATGQVEWPQQPGGQGPAQLPPHGIEHHYAPLAFFQGFPNKPVDLRRILQPIVLPKPAP